MNYCSLMGELTQRYQRINQSIERGLLPLLLLLCRWVAAWAFFQAGQVKIANWNSTLFLFEYEYQVPLLPFELAAYLAAGVELLLPPLLALGLLSRPVALLLFIFNAMAVISYPTLWENGFLDHQLWGLMLLTVFILGPGPLSADNLIKRKLCQAC